jgi:hypothetical protein
MSPRKTEIAPSHYAALARQALQRKRKHHKQKKCQRQSALDRLLSMLLGNQVLTFLEWCALNRPIGEADRHHDRSRSCMAGKQRASVI